MVTYQDHHWFDDDLSLDDIEEHDERGADSIIITDIGVLVKETKQYYLVASHREERNIIDSKGEYRNTVYKNTSRILKPTVLKFKKWHVDLLTASEESLTEDAEESVS